PHASISCRNPRRYCRARPRPCDGRRARHLRSARIRSREAPCVRGAGGADRAHRASTEGRCHRHGGGAQTTGAAMSEFTLTEVLGLVDLRRWGDKEPDQEGWDRIIAEFNRAYQRENFAEAYDSPHSFWARAYWRLREWTQADGTAAD